MAKTTVDAIRNGKDWFETKELRDWTRGDAELIFPPHAVGSLEQRALHQSITSELAAIDSLKAEIARIQLKINNIEQSIIKKVVLDAPIRRIPPEIFSLIVSFLPQTWHPDTGYPLRKFIRISKQWGRAVLDCPQLWSRFDLGGMQTRESSHLRETEVYLERCLARAKGAPLHFRIADPCPIAIPIAELMLKNAHRVAHISVATVIRSHRGSCHGETDGCHPNLSFIKHLLSLAENIRVFEFLSSFKVCAQGNNCLLLSSFKLPNTSTLKLIRYQDLEVAIPVVLVASVQTVELSPYIAYYNEQSDGLSKISTHYPNITTLSITSPGPRERKTCDVSFRCLRELQAPFTPMLARSIIRGSSSIINLTVHWELIFLSEVPHLTQLRVCLDACQYLRSDVISQMVKSVPSRTIYHPIKI
jgi:hypothetical protein